MSDQETGAVSRRSLLRMIGTDPQSGTNNLGTVQVTYTYCPFIPSWNFPSMGIYSTLPTCTGAGATVSGGTTINRVAAMRIMQ